MKLNIQLGDRDRSYEIETAKSVDRAIASVIFVFAGFLAAVFELPNDVTRLIASLLELT